MVGRWQTIDDKTGKPGSIVRTYLQEGKLFGKIEKILKPGVVQTEVCRNCKEERKDKPVVGMVFLWDLSLDGDEWKNGSVLDPEEGSIYRCKLKAVSADKLEIRGYIGISLFGRTQTWQRVADDVVPAAAVPPSDANAVHPAPSPAGK